MNPILAGIVPDVYKDFDPTGLVPELDMDRAWGSNSPVFAELIAQVRPHVIVELGSWKGHSAITMARQCHANGLNTAIICIDTWTGSEEHWLRHDWRAHLKLVNGYPTIYRQFLVNVIASGFQDMITPLPTTTLAGCNVLRQRDILADMIYVDANHDSDAVRLDIEHYKPLLRAGGVLFGHDLQHPPVRKCMAGYVGWHQADTDFWVMPI